MRGGSDAVIRYTDFVTSLHSVNNRPVIETTHIGNQVATGLLYCIACWLELWDSDAVFITQNSEVG